MTTYDSELTVAGARLVYQTVGTGPRGEIDPGTIPFFFQHGMGGDVRQPLGYVGADPAVPVISLNARGHSPSADIDAATASFDVFADDVIAVADRLGVGRFVIGGISLGAGTALNLAVRYPDRVAGLVLCRPAWLDQPQADFNRDAYSELADLLQTRGAEEAAVCYPRTPTFQAVQHISPSAASSLLGQLSRPRAAENALVLRTFPAISPTRTADGWRSITVPTLVVGHRDDPFHPYAMAETYAEAIPRATLSTVPSKDADPDRFASEIRTALHQFLRHL